jgi:hypothetical protein
MKDWRREWLFQQQRKKSFTAFVKPKERLTPLLKTPSGYYRSKPWDNIWRASIRKEARRHAREFKVTEEQKIMVAENLHKAVFGGEDET